LREHLFADGEDVDHALSRQNGRTVGESSLR
jgi:hypothetical protein